MNTLRYIIAIGGPVVVALCVAYCLGVEDGRAGRSTDD